MCSTLRPKTLRPTLRAAQWIMEKTLDGAVSAGAAMAETPRNQEREPGGHVPGDQGLLP